MHRNAHSITLKNLGLGPTTPIVISADMSKGATQRAVDELHLSKLILAGVDATPEQLIDLAEIPAPPEPSEEERAAEYAAALERKLIDRWEDERVADAFGIPVEYLNREAQP